MTCRSGCPVDRHTQHECQTFQTIDKIDVAGLNQKPGWFALLRCIWAKTNDLQTWSALQQLQDLTEDPGYATIKASNVQSVFELRKHLPVLDQVSSQEELVSLCGILDGNSFRRGESTRLLFGVLSMLNHDCSPNARVVFDSQQNGKLIAKCDLEPGTPITITYCSTISGTQERRSKLAQTKLFSCTCHRCSDPSEFGSYLSALKCPKCQSPTVLPDSFLDDETAWRCGDCPFKTTSHNVNKMIGALRKKVDAKESKDNLEKTLIQMLDQRLPRNHFLVLDLETVISHKCNKIRTLASVDRRLEIVQHRIDVLKLVDRGGTSRLAGFLAHKKQNLLVEKATLLKRQNLDLGNIGQEISATLQEAAEILHDDADCPPDLLETLKFFGKK